MSYAYSTTTGLLSSLNATVQNSSIPVTYTYQGANQLRSKAIGSVMTKAYNFGTSSGYRTALPNYVNYRDSSGNLIYGDNCYYDSNGRLVKILDSGSSTTTRATYGYDQQGQLTSAMVGGTRHTYSYDTAGNIQSKKVGSTTTNYYTYGNSAWRDLLTAYGGNTITYSGGNPTKYYDGSTFTWTQGRRLATAKVGSTNISYTYDMAGVRSSKTVGSTKYDFTTLSGLVTRQTGGGKTIDFVYDENNQPLAMKYNNTLYYYVLNAQGDVIALADQNGNLIAKYSYDPWGKLLSVTPNGWLDEQNAYYLEVAEANPLRYRGYYYDAETGFYYLQSRYYDPEIGRFINADSYASTDATGLLSTNMFAYCENDPVNRSDPSGELFGTISGLIVGGLTGALSAYINGDDILAGTITGAVNGGICGLIVDSGVFTGGISLLLCGVTGVLCEASNQAANGKTIKDMDYISIGLSGLFSAISCGWSNSIEKVMKEASKTATNAVATIRGVGISLVGIGTSKTHNDIKSKKNKKISDDQMRRWERMTEYYRHQVIK